MTKGKGRAANALKHGAYSREIMLPGERRKEYEALLAEVRQEWEPSGPTETSLVDRLASLQWRQRRLDIYEQAQISKRIEAVKANNRTVFARRRLKGLIPDIAAATTIKQVEQIFKKEQIDLSWIKTKVPRPAAEEEAKWGPAVAAFIEQLEIGKRLEGAEEFAAIVNPMSDPLDIIRSNRMEEEIDRTIKRLMQVKTHKRLFGGGMPASQVIDVSPQKEITGPKQKRSTATKGTSAFEEIAKSTKQKWESESGARADGEDTSPDF